MKAQKLLTQRLRPGGWTLTQHVLSMRPPRAGECWADLGCGTGETVRRLLREYGVHAIGVDSDATAVQKARQSGPDSAFLCANAAYAPMPGAVLHGILMECSLSQMPLVQTLNTCRRLLRPQGALLLTDVYARGIPMCTGGLLGDLHTQEQLVAALTQAGFVLQTFEDHSQAVEELRLQMVWECGAEAVAQAVGLPREAYRAVRCGYYVAWAQKEGCV